MKKNRELVDPWWDKKLNLITGFFIDTRRERQEVSQNDLYYNEPINKNSNV